jgi:Concanavalin A-like lectin/glucanases superfamily
MLGVHHSWRMKRRALGALSLLCSVFAAVLGFGLATPAPAGALPLVTRFFVDIGADDGLVAYFKFDEDGGTLTRSFPNTALTGTLAGGATFTTAHPAAIQRFDPFALSLNGGLVSVISNTALNGLTQTFTVAAWVRRTATGFNHYAIYDSGTATNHWWVFIDEIDRLGFGERNIAEYYSTGTITDTNWHHVAVVSTGAASNNLRLYIDGALDSTHTITPVALPSGNKTIGRLSTSPVAFFAGQIDELRVYDKLLSTTDIQRLANGRGCSTSGLSWASAFSDLQCALDPALNPQEVWVAVSPVLSRYYMPGTSPSATFALGSGVALHGGFAGNESSLSQRPYVNFNTFDILGLANTPTSWLRGDMLGDDGNNYTNYGDNVHHVVSIQGSGVTLDGFSIQGGNASDSGGGLYQLSGSATISMTAFYANRANFGGGLAICCGGKSALQNLIVFGNSATGGDGGGLSLSGGASVTLTDAVIWLNSAAAGFGGGIEMAGGTRVAISRATLRDNQASAGGGMRIATTQDVRVDAVALQHNSATQGGGGIAVQTASGITLTNLEMVGNQAGTQGGGILVSTASALLVNASVVSNTATSGGALASIQSGNLRAENSILWANAPQQFALASGGTVSVSHSIVQGGWPTGTVIFNVDPQFVRLPNIGNLDFGDLHLRILSPAIDAGSNVLVPAGITRDIEGRPRFVDVPSVPDTGIGPAPIVDMGAHEVPIGLYLPLIQR